MTTPSRPTCNTDGCHSPVKARNLCSRHYAEDLARRNGRTCNVEGCARPPGPRNYCWMHYYRVQKHGEAGEATPRRKGARPCVVDGCPNGAVTSRDLCPTHARRKRLYGTSTGSFTTHKKCVVCGEPAMFGVRSSEHCEPHYVQHFLDMHLRGDEPGVRHANGYVYLDIRKRRYAVHRLVMERMLGRPLLPFESAHHKNGRRDDNTPANLELWTKPQPAGQRPEDLVAWVMEFYAEIAVRNHAEAIVAELARLAAERDG